MVALAITNTLLGCIGGGLAVLFIIKIFKGGKWSLIQLVNGCLAGLKLAALFLLLLLIVIGTLPLNIYVYESLEEHMQSKSMITQYEQFLFNKVLNIEIRSGSMK